jgi:hypothetical protein
VAGEAALGLEDQVADAEPQRVRRCQLGLGDVDALEGVASRTCSTSSGA